MNEIGNINFLFFESEKIQLDELSNNKSDNFIIAEVDQTTFVPIQDFIKKESFTLIIVTQGTLSISMEREKRTIGANMVVRSIPGNTIQLNSVSADFCAKIISVNRDLLNLTTTGFSPGTYLFIRQNPTFGLTQSETEDILEIFHLIKKKTRTAESNSKEKVFHCLIMALYHELTGCINKKTEDEPLLHLSHKENLYKRFLTLLRENIHKEHSVTFYANQLCLTPQYISSVLKEMSGMSANKWIDEMLLSEAKILLFSTENNIQQIADKLYFPDQSSFGKFFKKMTGVSPSNYKKQAKLNRL